MRRRGHSWKKLSTASLKLHIQVPLLLQKLERIGEQSLMGINHCDPKARKHSADYNNFKVEIIDFELRLLGDHTSLCRVLPCSWGDYRIQYGSNSDGHLHTILDVCWTSLISRQEKCSPIGRIQGLFGSLSVFMLKHGTIRVSSSRRKMNTDWEHQLQASA